MAGVTDPSKKKKRDKRTTHITTKRNSMTSNEQRQVVVGYLRGNGLTHGFLYIDVSRQPSKKPAYIQHFFLGRKTQREIFTDIDGNMQNPDEIIVIYDAELQQGPVGLIKTPYLFLRRTATEKKYVDLTEDHKDKINSIAAT